MVGGKIKLRGKRLADTPDDYAWQTDPELAELDAAPLLTISFSQYLSSYASELRHPSSTPHRFAIETLNGEHIGNCTFYDINRTRGEAELGIMIGNRDYWDKGYGADAVNAMVDYVFQTTDLHRLYLKTLDWNQRAQKCFAKCGFTPCGHIKRNSYSFVIMELKREQWERQHGEKAKKNL